VGAETPAYLFWRAGYQEAEWEAACKSGGAAMLALLKQRQQQMYPDLRTLPEDFSTTKPEAHKIATASGVFGEPT
jgi:hypothetical protein